jgi:hypothetical protein
MRKTFAYCVEIKCFTTEIESQAALFYVLICKSVVITNDNFDGVCSMYIRLFESVICLCSVTKLIKYTTKNIKQVPALHVNLFYHAVNEVTSCTTSGTRRVTIGAIATYPSISPEFTPPPFLAGFVLLDL